VWHARYPSRSWLNPSLTQWQKKTKGKKTLNNKKQKLKAKFLGKRAIEWQPFGGNGRGIRTYTPTYTHTFKGVKLIEG